MAMLMDLPMEIQVIIALLTCMRSQIRVNRRALKACNVTKRNVTLQYSLKAPKINEQLAIVLARFCVRLSQWVNANEY